MPDRDEALIEMSEAIARRATTEAQGEFYSYAYKDEPNTFYRSSPYRAIGGISPAYSYWNTEMPVPLGGGWEIPGNKEMFWGEHPESGTMMSVNRRSLYPEVPMASPGPGATPLPGGGYDFGTAQFSPGPSPTNRQINEAVGSLLPDELELRPGKLGTPVPALPIRDVPFLR